MFIYILTKFRNIAYKLLQAVGLIKWLDLHVTVACSQPA